MREVLQNMMSITKLSTPGYVEPVEAFNVEKILTEVASLVQPRACVPIEVIVDHDTGYDVVGHKFVLKLVMYNIVGNSAKFTSKGHIILRATLLDDGRTLNVVVEVT